MARSGTSTRWARTSAASPACCCGACSSSFAPEGLLHYGQGKWYPGEPLPRWALTCLWRADGMPLWRDARLTAQEGTGYGHGWQRRAGASPACWRDASACTATISSRPTRMSGMCSKPSGPCRPMSTRCERDLKDAAERSRLARLLEASSSASRSGSCCRSSLRPSPRRARRRWLSSRWPLRREHLYLMPGDSPLGLRLPLELAALGSARGP